ncbi:MAG: hypothetical protein IJ228_11010 [Succinivibrio sp.]|nr:hypothetical protein [Succinivibrio sp.]
MREIRVQAKGYMTIRIPDKGQSEEEFLTAAREAYDNFECDIDDDELLPDWSTAEVYDPEA